MTHGSASAARRRKAELCQRGRRLLQFTPVPPPQFTQKCLKPTGDKALEMGDRRKGGGSPCRWEHGTRRRTTRGRLVVTDGTVPGIAGQRALGEGDRGRGVRTPRPCQPMVGLGLLQAFLGGCHPCHRTRSAGGEKKPGRFSSGDRMGWESCRRGAAGWSGLLQIPKSPNPPKASCGNCSGAEDLRGVPCAPTALTQRSFPLPASCRAGKDRGESGPGDTRCGAGSVGQCCGGTVVNGMRDKLPAWATPSWVDLLESSSVERDWECWGTTG